MCSASRSTGGSADDKLRIAYIAAGAGGMVCGTCLHDNTLAAALSRIGEEIVLLPTYTPLKTDELDVSERRVFLGGINVYLGQKISAFRKAPRWLHRLLDNRTLLAVVGGRAGSVDPARLGDLTVSVLQGRAGSQAREIDELIDWLATDFRPDIVHLSNSMLTGMAAPMRDRLKVPIVCSLSGEDIFLERLTPPHYEAARQLLRDNAKQVDVFVALNHYFADYMAGYLNAPRERIAVVPHGLNLEGHAHRQPSQGPPWKIGYLARVCHDKGLHLLIDAREQLAADNRLGEFEVSVAGYLAAGDRKYLRRLEDQARRGPLAGRLTYRGELSRHDKLAFLQSLDVFALPTVYVESKGLSAVEALANGVPVVLPDHGCFPELIRDTGGGLLFRPGDPADLAAKIGDLLLAPDHGNEYGSRGFEAVRQRYHAATMAEQTRQIYRRTVGK